MRISSDFSSATAFSSSFARPMIARGSTKAVSPDLEMSWTTPGTCPLASMRTGITHLPDLLVTKSSWRNTKTLSSLTISSSFFLILVSSLLISPRRL
jgi:hypothetical protein